MLEKQNVMLEKQSSKFDVLIDYGEKSKDEIKKLNQTVKRSNTLLEYMNEGLDDVNLRAENMQYFIVYQDVNNELKLLFNFGGQKHIRAKQRVHNIERNICLVSETYTPGGVSLRKRCINQFQEVNSSIREELIENLREEGEDDDDIEREIKLYDNLPAIIADSTKFEVNARYSEYVNIHDIIGIIMRTHNARFNRRAELIAEQEEEQ